MKNINVLLAKSYIKKFYEVLALSMNEKDLKELKKKVAKYEDTSYLKDILNDEAKANFINDFNKHKEENTAKYQSLIEDLNRFYASNMEGKEIIDVASIKKELEVLSNKLTSSNQNEYLKDINQLFEFKNNIIVELDVYTAKHKSEEYMDMSIFHNNVKAMIKDAQDILKDLIMTNKMDENEYYPLYINNVYHQFSVLFENGANKVRTVPGWAKGLLFCTPWIIGFLLFTLYPLINTLIFSFSTVTPSPDGFTSSFIGFKNYANIFTSDTDFINAIKNYLVEMVVYVPLITIFSLILAMLLNTKIKTKGFFRTIFFLPVVVTSGPVLKILIEQGVTSMPGITQFNLDEITSKMPELVRIAFNILTSKFIEILWFSGIQILVFLTSLQKIDKGVYEASAIDGANKWEQFWKVTLPAINPTIVINVVFTVVMQSIFALNPIILKIQSDMNSTEEGKGYGYSSAVAFTYFFVMIIVLIIFVLIFKKHDKRQRKAVR